MADAPKTLQEAIQYYSDPEVCIQAVAKLRWPDGVPVCPACGHKEHYYLKSQRRWKCKECWKQFSVKVGTIFEDSPIGLDKWLVVMWMLVNCRNGVSSYEAARAIGVTQKSGWFMLQRIRLAMQERRVGFTKIGGPNNEIEVDETFIGGQKRNMHRDKAIRYEARGGSKGKAIVQGIFDRETRKVRATIVPDVKRETLQSEVLSHVKYGSTVYSDNAVAYDKLNWRYIHEVVNHAEKYVEGRVHTNSLENFWSLLKRNLSGTYVAVEPFHLERYLDEQVFRFNNRKDGDRKVTDAERFERVLSQIANRRLTYAELTGKAGAATKA